MEQQEPLDDDAVETLRQVKKALDGGKMGEMSDAEIRFYYKKILLQKQQQAQPLAGMGPGMGQGMDLLHANAEQLPMSMTPQEAAQNILVNPADDSRNYEGPLSEGSIAPGSILGRDKIWST